MSSRTLGVFKRLGILIAIVAYYSLWVRITAWFGATSGGVRGIPRQVLEWYQMPEMSTELWTLSLLCSIMLVPASALVILLLAMGVVQLFSWLFKAKPEEVERDKQRALEKQRKKLAASTPALEAQNAKLVAERANLQEEVAALKAAKVRRLAENGEPVVLTQEQRQQPLEGHYEQPPTPSVA